MDLSTATVTILTGMISLLCGAAAGSYFNLKSSRKDIIFKRKLEYFEKLSQNLESNLRNYKSVILSLSPSSKKKEIEKKMSELKQNRKTFLVLSSPLYFDTSIITEKITAFVEIEKEIFAFLKDFAKNHKDISIKKRKLFDLNNSLGKLNEAEREIIYEMRMELHKR